MYTLQVSGAAKRGSDDLNFDWRPLRCEREPWRLGAGRPLPESSALVAYWRTRLPGAALSSHHASRNNGPR